MSSKALLIPMLWLGTIGSRPYSFWLAWIGIGTSGGDQDGNPIDLAIFLGLMVAALIVLKRRGFSWGAFFSRNKILMLLYLFLALSASWSEFSFPTLKRIVKDYGAVITALVVLTEVNPLESIRLVVVRAAYVMFPLSVVFIKYFPSIGRTVARGGDNMPCGVSMHKSHLGAILFLFGLFIVLDLMALYRQEPSAEKRRAIWLRFGILAMGGWLMAICQSVTSLLCFSLGCFLLWGSGRLARMQNPFRVLISCIAVFVVVVISEKSLDLSGSILEALGKSRTLTGRTEIWDMAQQARIEPVFGSGYFSFWHTSEAERIQQEFIFMNSAHNGFIDMYLGGGFVGVGLLVVLLVVWGRRSARLMLAGNMFGRVALTIWVLGIAFNNSETAFFRLDPSWFLMLLLLIETPRSYLAANAIPDIFNEHPAPHVNQALA